MTVDTQESIKALVRPKDAAGSLLKHRTNRSSMPINPNQMIPLGALILDLDQDLLHLDLLHQPQETALISTGMLDAQMVNRLDIQMIGLKDHSKLF